MRIFESIRQTVAIYLFKKEFDLQRRDVIVNNIDAVSSVGIIFYADSEENYRAVSKFSLLLRKEGVKNVHILGYVNAKELPSYLSVKLGYDFILKKDLNWYLKPVSTSSQNFIHEAFDILIDLSCNNILPLQYILGKSSAHFKVGKGKCGKDFLLDMMINLDEGGGTENLSQQILYYLKQINKVDGDVIALLR